MQIYQAFKRALRETKNWIVPKQAILDELEVVNFESDIGFNILKAVNEHYCQLQKEKIERESKIPPKSRADND